MADNFDICVAFDRDPPINYFGSGTGSALYDNIGRLLYVGATYRF